MKFRLLISQCYCWVFLVFLGIASPAVAADAEKGKEIFDSVCKYCHQANYDDKFGPGLQGINERVSEQWLNRFLKDPIEMIKSDEYAQGLHESNAYSLTMPRIPSMQDDIKRANIIEYLKTLK